MSSAPSMMPTSCMGVFPVRAVLYRPGNEIFNQFRACGMAARTSADMGWQKSVCAASTPTSVMARGRVHRRWAAPSTSFMHIWCGEMTQEKWRGSSSLLRVTGVPGAAQVFTASTRMTVSASSSRGSSIMPSVPPSSPAPAGHHPLLEPFASSTPTPSSPMSGLPAQHEHGVGISFTGQPRRSSVYSSAFMNIDPVLFIPELHSLA